MKKLIYACACLAIMLAVNSCDEPENGNGAPKTYEVQIQLVYPEGIDVAADVTVNLLNTVNDTAYDAVTNDDGVAAFTVTAGLYSASVTERRVVERDAYIYSGSASSIQVTDAWDATTPVEITLVESKTNQIIIKELYFGGCPKGGEQTGSFSNDKFIILYNNSDQPASLAGVAIAYVYPFNSNATNNNYVDGVLTYTPAGTIPVCNGAWEFPVGAPELAPYSQVVIALSGAVDHTQTYAPSINFVNADYWVAYNPELYTSTSVHPAPDAIIPTSHYLQGYKFPDVKGTAWSMSNASPAVIVFAADEETTLNSWFTAAKDMFVQLSQVQIPISESWVLDGVEIFKADATTNQKRLTTTIDNGYLPFTNALGYTAYRNVDKEATEAIEGNSALLVYNYAGGTGEDDTLSTDASGIDAEASIKAGAKIIYKDTNNSGADFHQRAVASLK